MIRFPEGGFETPNRADAFSLTFTADGKVSGTTDCNNFSGTYSLEGDRLAFGSLMSTLMFCDGSQETEYTSSLAHAERILFNKNGDLTVVLGDGRGEMLYVPKE
jgi:heat shock protein HslJ